MLTVCLMKEEDLDEVAAIERELFSQPWSRKGFRDSLNQKSTLYLTARLDGNVVGYCGLFQALEVGEITNVAVDPRAWNQGVATAMLSGLLEMGEKRGIESFTLEVRKGNARAIHVYEKLGFVNSGIRKNFYELPTEDAVIMWKGKRMV